MLSVHDVRVLVGLKELSVFLLDQVGSWAKDTKASNERKRIARENVPWDWVKEPKTLAEDLAKLVGEALGEKVLPIKLVAASGGGRGKRKNATTGIEEEGGRKKFKNWDVSETPSPVLAPSVFSGSGGAKRNVVVGGRDEGEIISRKVEPVIVENRVEDRVEEGKEALGSRKAEVRESRSTQVVVRKVRDGEMEVRTVITKVERIRWLKDHELAVTVKEEETERSLPTPSEENGEHHTRSTPFSPSPDVALSANPPPTTSAPYEFDPSVVPTAFDLPCGSSSAMDLLSAISTALPSQNEFPENEFPEATSSLSLLASAAAPQEFSQDLMNAIGASLPPEDSFSMAWTNEEM